MILSSNGQWLLKRQVRLVYQCKYSSYGHYSIDLDLYILMYYLFLFSSFITVYSWNYDYQEIIATSVKLIPTIVTSPNYFCLYNLQSFTCAFFFQANRQYFIRYKTKQCSWHSKVLFMPREGCSTLYSKSVLIHYAAENALTLFVTQLHSQHNCDSWSCFIAITLFLQ